MKSNRNGNLGMKHPKDRIIKNSLGQLKYRREKRKKDFEKYSGLIKILEKDEIFNGLMLSDGCIAKREVKTQNSRFSLNQKDKNEQFILKIQKYFQDLGIESTVSKYLTKDKRKEWKDNWGIQLYTKYNVIFSQMRKTWYSSDRKIIPKDLKLTPKTLAYLFMGDGYSTWKNGKCKTVGIGICTESFSLDDVKLIKYKLEKLGISNIKFRKRRNNQYRLTIEKNSETTKFMKLIEPYIIPIFKYKIKYPKITQEKLL